MSDHNQNSSPIQLNDVLGALFLNATPPPAATLDNTALLIIDCQHLGEPAYLESQAVKAGMPQAEVKEALADFTARYQSALHNTARVLQAARQAGIPPIHTKIQALTANGRDTSALHSRFGWNFPPNSPATQFVEPTKPLDNEIVITKVASGAFTGTSLDATLKNMGIEHLLICGFMADECVETTVRVALDYGYATKVVSDTTTAYHAESAEATIGKFTSYGFAQSADETIAQFQAMAADRG